jgi:hypothetical protein
LVAAASASRFALFSAMSSSNDLTCTAAAALEVTAAALLVLAEGAGNGRFVPAAAPDAVPATAPDAVPVVTAAAGAVAGAAWEAALAPPPA